jgi:hypothetical protein
VPKIRYKNFYSQNFLQRKTMLKIQKDSPNQQLDRDLLSHGLQLLRLRAKRVVDSSVTGA